jgi:hypothetical protein
MGPTNPELEAVKLGEKGTPSTEFCKLQSSHTRKHILDPYARTSGRDPACSWRGVGGGGLGGNGGNFELVVRKGASGQRTGKKRE